MGFLLFKNPKEPQETQSFTKSNSDESISPLFLDRKGNIIKGKNYLFKPEKIELIRGAKKFRIFRKEGWSLVIVTNQSGIEQDF